MRGDWLQHTSFEAHEVLSQELCAGKLQWQLRQQDVSMPLGLHNLQRVRPVIGLYPAAGHGGAGAIGCLPGMHPLHSSVQVALHKPGLVHQVPDLPPGRFIWQQWQHFRVDTAPSYLWDRPAHMLAGVPTHPSLTKEDVDALYKDHPVLQADCDIILHRVTPCMIEGWEVALACSRRPGLRDTPGYSVKSALHEQVRQ